MGTFTEKFGAAKFAEVKADKVNYPNPNASPKCPNCKSDDLFNSMSMDGKRVTVCKNCRKEIEL